MHMFGCCHETQICKWDARKVIASLFYALQCTVARSDAAPLEMFSPVGIYIHLHLQTIKKQFYNTFHLDLMFFSMNVHIYLIWSNNNQKQ